MLSEKKHLPFSGCGPLDQANWFESLACL